MRKKKILVVDDEEALRYTLNIFLRDDGYDVALAANFDEAVALMATEVFDLMFVDIIMDGKSGIELLRTVKKGNPNAQVIIITGAPSVDTATEALRLGALDYIIKPIRQNELLKVARIALRHKDLSDEKDRCRANVDTIFRSVEDGIITVDNGFRVSDINEAAMRLCGFREGEKLKLDTADESGRCCGACYEILQESFSAKKSSTVHHIECRRNDYRDQIVSISISPLIDHMENFLGCVMVVRDETQLLNLQKSANENKFFNRLVGVSDEMKKVKDLIKVMAPVQTTLLITGESGTGKELTVDALHSAGDRSRGPLIKVNCGALSDSILESELFGHIRGAFTGAQRDRVGRFHMAHGGIIFLDEIGDVSTKMQLQLLRVIETMSFERVGSSKTEKVDVRIVAATNLNLADKVAQGEFRSDLFYRLKVVELTLPALRDRRCDIPLLTSHMIQKFNQKFKKQIIAVSSDVEKFFQNYDWPGNVRELENCMEYACIMCNQSAITVAHLPVALRQLIEAPQLFVTGDSDQEVKSIKKALARTDGNKAKAARLLSMSRRTIYRKVQKYNIDS